MPVSFDKPKQPRTFSKILSSIWHVCATHRVMRVRRSWTFLFKLRACFRKESPLCTKHLSKRAMALKNLSQNPPNPRNLSIQRSVETVQKKMMVISRLAPVVRLSRTAARHARASTGTSVGTSGFVPPLKTVSPRHAFSLQGPKMTVAWYAWSRSIPRHPWPWNAAATVSMRDAKKILRISVSQRLALSAAPLSHKIQAAIFCWIPFLLAGLFSLIEFPK